MSKQGSLRLVAGMVGGGQGADIGKTHRYAMRLDDRYELHAGVFGRDGASSARIAGSLGVPADRTYRDYREMAEREAAREDGVDVVAVTTPNDSHFDIARTFLEAGISVVCEKPLTPDSASAAELVAIAESSGAILAVPHCYSAYAMVRHAARMVRDGDLGRIRFAAVEHASGWAAAPVELGEHRQARWRTDPGVAGFPSVVGDLGTHAFHLLRYVTGLEATRVSAELDTLVPGRRVFDNATVRLTLSNGAPATLWASMAATGNEHGLRIRVFGDTASIEWRHEDPQHLTVRDLDGGTTILAQGMRTLSEDAGRLTRPGLGHPEGFLEAFANFYRDLADELRARRDGGPTTVRDLSFPTGRDGLIGVQLVEATAASHAADSAWVVPAFAHDKSVSDMQRFALIGAGFIGGVHGANLAAHPDVDLALVFDIDLARATDLAKRHGSRATTDLAEAFDPTAIDAVLIASSTDTHAEHLRTAATAGIPALCEKPIDLDLARAVDVVRFAETRSLRAMVDFNRRFDRDYAELQRVVTSGEIGSVELIQLTSRGPAMPPLEYVAVSGGQMRDQTVHFFDLARWISGLDPESVFATGSTLAEPRLAEYGDVDTSAVTLRLPGGALVQIDCTRRIGYGYDERIEVLGSTGMVEARRQRAGSVSRYSAGRVVDDGLHAGWFERIRGSYRTALDHFVDALENGAPIGPTLAEALKAQAIAEAAARSLTSGRMEPIEYPV